MRDYVCELVRLNFVQNSHFLCFVMSYNLLINKALGRLFLAISIYGIVLITVILHVFTFDTFFLFSCIGNSRVALCVSLHSYVSVHCSVS